MAMTLFRKLVLMGLLIITTASAAENASACERRRNRYGAHPENMVEMIPLKPDCVIFLHPRGGPGVSEELNRDLMFSSKGGFHVFNFYGFDGDIKDNLSLRSFFMVPRRGPVDYAIDVDGNLLVRLASGETAIFDYQTGNLAAGTDFEFSQDQKIHRRNQGGVELLGARNSIIVDAGWRVGAAPESLPNQLAAITDPMGRICRIKNGMIFKSNNPKDPDDVLLLPDAQLKQILSASCPTLDLSPFDR